MGAEIAVRKVTPPRRNLAHLRESARAHADAGARRVAVALNAYEFEIEKMSARAAVAQQQRRVAVIGHDDIQNPVVVEIKEPRPPSRRRRRETLPPHLRRFAEVSPARSAEALTYLFLPD